MLVLRGDQWPVFCSGPVIRYSEHDTVRVEYNLSIQSSGGLKLVPKLLSLCCFPKRYRCDAALNFPVTMTDRIQLYLG